MWLTYGAEVWRRVAHLADDDYGDGGDGGDGDGGDR